MPRRVQYRTAGLTVCSCHVLVAALLGAVPPAAAEVLADNLADMTLEQLSNLEVTSVSRRSERILDAPASIFVITAEDIRRTGVSTLPEALRLAPNLQVARVNASDYGISARGFNNSIGNKLLVLVDGRTVYTPLFSGVFWDAQDVMLEDVDRIEVISGPGASLWGANAVNGVINVITRSAQDSQGMHLQVRGGNRENGGAFRYGGKIGADGAYRVYAKVLDEDNTETGAGQRVLDSWRKEQLGFRIDWRNAADSFTWQGDAYRANKEAQSALGAPERSGANLLLRWNRQLADGGEVRAQSYIDHSERRDPISFQDRIDIFDVEFQHALPQTSTHRFLWGGGTRHARDHATPGVLTAFLPGDRKLHWTNLFAQDEFAVSENLTVTLGAKLESNVYTGVEFLPNLRLAWKPSGDQLLWGALSRAVRAPSRIDREFYFPGRPPYFINGGPNVQSEVAYVTEVGYRAQLGRYASFSATVFHHDYDKLRSGQPPPAIVENKIEGTVSGIEAWGGYQVGSNWKITAGALWQERDLRKKPGSTDPVGPSALGNDPKYQLMLRSALAITSAHDLDIRVRRVGALPNPAVPAYTSVDIRFGWQIDPRLNVSVVVGNAFDRKHVELNNPATASVFERSTMLQVQWRP